MTQQDIKNKISALERGIKSPATPPAMKKQMETQLEKLRAQIGSSESSVSPAFEKGQKVHLKNVPEKTGTIGFERNGLWYVKFPDGSDGEFSASDLVVSGKGTKKSAKADKPAAVPASLKEQSVSQLVSTWTSAEKKRGKGNVINEMQRRLKLKGTSEQDRKEIMEFLGVNGKARYKEKYILSDGRDVRDVPCSELVQMVVERRQAAIKSGKKSKAKPVMEKVTKHITLAVKESIEEIPADQIKKDPAKFKREMKALVRETKAYIAKLKKVLGKAFDASEIETMATEIEKLISEKAEKMGLGGVVLGFALGAGTMHVINKGKEADKPDTTGKKFSYLPPVENFPDKIQFWDDIKAWEKEGMQDGPMPRKFRHHEKFVNGEWKEISKKEWDAIFTQGSYKRKQRSEKGKFVYYRVDKKE